MSKPHSAIDVAKWFLAWAQDEDEGALSNLKLQKLLYYAQGHHLARYGQPLFRDEIQAWSHGPVVPAVYHAFKSAGSGPIDFDDADFDFDTFDRRETKHLVSVWETFGAMSAWKLRNMTHEESPWKRAFKDDVRHVPIPVESMHEHFTRLYARKK